VKTWLKRLLPRKIRLWLAYVYYGVIDFWEMITGKTHSLVPPWRMIFVGTRDFVAVGEEFLQHFIKLGHLKPEHQVLDIGSGIGRMAVPLTSYLSNSARYEGVDIVSQGVRWCQENITPRFPNFQFQLADIFNQEYNPQGQYAAVDYKLPFSPNTFDFVFLTSVFTHMLPAEVENYLSQIQRVLKPEGQAFLTFFLWNEESKAGWEQGKSTQDFLFSEGIYRVVDLKVPENSIAYEEVAVREILKTTGLALENTYYGSWCGREKFKSYQDILIVKKEG
jgi:ubiquinone/menaquinone biosynthesis C-methylase UbiE